MATDGRARARLGGAGASALLALALALLAGCTDDTAANQSPTATKTRTASPKAQTAVPGASNADQPNAPTLTDGSLVVEKVADLDSPTQMAFLGPDDVLVTQKTGKVVRVRGGDVDDVIELRANFADERGVLGITLHPDFEQNGFVYVYWTWAGDGEAPDGLLGDATDAIDAVPANGNRVDRFRWDGNSLEFDRNIIELPSRSTDLTLNRRRGNHNAGVIKFGPDGMLYVVIGDQNVRGVLTNVEEGESIEESGIVGAVLRLHDDGSVPADNPFTDLGEPRSRMFVYGLRNSFGYDFDPENGNFWLEVNGQAAYDQIGRYQAGDNVGWIQLMGPPDRFEDYRALEVDTTRKLDNPSYPPERLAGSTTEALERLVLFPGATYRAPVFAWRFAPALTDIEFVEAPELGARYQGDLFAGDVNTGTLYRFALTDDRAGLALTGGLADGVNDNTMENRIGELGADHVFGRGFGVVTDIESGPDGALWVTSISQNAIYRIASR